MAEKEYIERDKLIKDGWHLQRYAHGNDYVCVESMSIRDIPAADVRPVVRGRWVTRPYMMGQTEYCSRCGENYGRKHNFCPNCGADMREEQT